MATSYAFDWSSQPEFNDIKYNSPRPCNHGANCVYSNPTRCCAFVHPGEEGTGRRLFPAFIRKNNDGTSVWMPAAVRLIGGASFYERRRLNLSWPEWCFRQGLPGPTRRPARPEKINLEVSEAQVQQGQAQPMTQAEADQALKCHFRLCGPCERCTPAQAQAPLVHAQQQQQQQQQAEPRQKPGDDVRTALYIAISMGLAYGRDAMIQTGTVHKDITPAKITGMILDSFDLDECKRLVDCPTELGQRMLSCCEAIMKNAAPAAQTA